MEGKLILIDGNSLLNRAFYAMPTMTTKDGLYTNAAYGFINMLIRLITDEKPEYMAVAFDMRAKTFRHAMYDGYKATRKGMPDELAVQMPIAHELLTAMGITIVEREGIEADDVLGTLAKKFDVKTIIVTGDRDALQLIDDTTCVYLTKRGITDIDEVDVSNIVEKYGMSPLGVIEYKALRGDTSDNIPGVKGIGEKTALALLGEYGTLENVYNNLDNINGKLREKLIDGRQMAELSRALATIDIACDIDLELGSLKYGFPFSERVRELFNRYEFRSLLRRAELFGQDAADSPQADMVSIECIQLGSAENLSELLTKVEDIIAVSFEGAEVRISLSPGSEYMLRTEDTFLPDAFNMQTVMDMLAPIFADERVKKVFFDSKTVRHLADSYSVKSCKNVDDISLMAYLVNSGKDPKSAAVLLETQGISPNNVAAGLLRLRKTFLEQIVELEMSGLYELESELSEVLARVEKRGFRVDGDVLVSLGERYRLELDKLSADIYEKAGEQFNINSTRQLSTVLFDKLGLKSGRKNKTGRSTDIEVLESLEGEHPLVGAVIRYRKLSKLLSTYIDGIKPLIDVNDRVHTCFRQTLTTTGRLSSTEPNLQNIPVRTDDGREIRRMFVSGDSDSVLISADYSQIELRLLAHFSGDEKLIEAFNSGDDIHARTASDLFGVPQGEVTSDMRRAAKTVNFGIIYGISDYGLSSQLKCPVKQAKEFIEAYFRSYPSVREYMRGNVEFANEHGYGVTLLGRRRSFPELKSPNYNVRSFGERAAMNMPLQGSAADIIKLAMVAVDRELNARGMRTGLVLQVHDELIVDAPQSEADEAAKLLKDKMENCISLRVPLIVDVARGANWFDAK